MIARAFIGNFGKFRVVVLVIFGAITVLIIRQSKQSNRLQRASTLQQDMDTQREELRQWQQTHKD